jgi:hypothetical protein
MDLISKEMFLNLGIDYNDAGLLFHYLHDRKISKKKNFIKIIEVKITDDQRDVYSSRFRGEPKCNDIYHHREIESQATIGFLRSIVGLTKDYVDDGHLYQINSRANENYLTIMRNFWDDRELSLPLIKKMRFNLRERKLKCHDFLTNKAYNATKYGREKIVNYFFYGYIQDISPYINVYLTEKNLEKIKKQEKHRYLPNKYQFISHEFEYPKKLKYVEELDLERLIKYNQNQYKEKQKKFNERRQRRKVNVVYFNTKSTKSKKITYRSRYNFRNLKKVLESESEMLNYY